MGFSPIFQVEVRAKAQKPEFTAYPPAEAGGNSYPPLLEKINGVFVPIFLFGSLHVLLIGFAIVMAFPDKLHFRQNLFWRFVTRRNGHPLVFFI